MNNTLYVSDLDGTLLDRDAKLPKVSEEIINKLISKGMEFTIATARSWSSASKIVRGLNLKLPVATYNGAFIIDPISGSVIESSCFEKEQIEYIVNTSKKANFYPLVYSFIKGEEKVSWVVGQENDGISDYLESRKGDKRLRPVSSMSDLFVGDIFYLTAIGTRHNLEPLIPLFEDERYFSHTFQKELYKEDEYWFEVKKFDATKAIGIEKIKKITGCSRIVCFGDSSNDIPMFTISDEAYAVVDADPRLIKIATGVIRGSNENGVAMWLEKNVLEF